MYKIVYVKRFHLAVPSKDNDGRFFVVVSAHNGKKYQVKFNTKSAHSNQKELIANFVAKEINAPVPDGAFLKFSKRQMDGIKEKIGFDDTTIKDETLFGIEWQEVSITLQDDNDLLSTLKECKNKDEFYSIYPFDQYLRNHDRIIHNHLFYKPTGHSKPFYYSMIDADRIFGSTSWDRIEIEKDNFSCYGYDFYKYLYSLVTDREFTFVYRYVAIINTISISTLQKIISNYYKNINEVYDTILKILSYRKDEMFYRCDGSCFPNVKTKSVIRDCNV